ncbi:unnamed protein product [Lepeophtheirus salmonis]|uniref:RNA-directed DNA polymerase n=1 Tax=Lepeophtheirus salmonis TaxID=72036 RepID=A0A817FBJ0_LEPSM|nr:unnamed protein product [Lepeophtheirus salmonis]
MLIIVDDMIIGKVSVRDVVISELCDDMAHINETRVRTYSQVWARLNRNKCTFAVPDLTYLGFKISKHEVKSFLGLVNFYGHFVKNLSSLAYPLSELTKLNIVFKWLDEESESFSSIKKDIKEASCLTHYDSSMPLILSTDASPLGRSAVLSQADKANESPPIWVPSTKSIGASLTAINSKFSTFGGLILALLFVVIYPPTSFMCGMSSQSSLITTSLTETFTMIMSSAIIGTYSSFHSTYLLYTTNIYKELL